MRIICALAIGDYVTTALDSAAVTVGDGATGRSRSPDP